MVNENHMNKTILSQASNIHTLEDENERMKDWEAINRYYGINGLLLPRLYSKVRLVSL